jgi:hypothetical protein
MRPAPHSAVGHRKAGHTLNFDSTTRRTCQKPAKLGRPELIRTNEPAAASLIRVSGFQASRHSRRRRLSSPTPKFASQ